MYGVVPPETVDVNVTGLPTVGLALTVKLAVSVRGATVIGCDALPTWGGVDVSDTDNETVNVPFAVYAWVGFAVVAAGLPSPKFHE